MHKAGAKGVRLSRLGGIAQFAFVSWPRPAALQNASAGKAMVELAPAFMRAR